MYHRSGIYGRILFISIVLLTAGVTRAAVYSSYIPRANQYSFVFHQHCNVAPDDGSLSPIAIGETLLTNNISAYAITPHDSVIIDPGVVGIKWFRGEECTVIAPTSSPQSHALMLFMSSVVSGSQSAQTAFNDAKSKGAFISLAHPDYDSLYFSTNDMMSLTNYDALEINNLSVGYATNHWDYALSHNKRLWGTAGTDAHVDASTNLFQYVNADSLDDIPKELAAGNFYMSYYDMKLTVTTNGADTITVTSDSSGTFTWIVDGVNVRTSGSGFSDSYTLYPSNVYGRCVFHGVGFAWTQPIYYVGMANITNVRVKNLHIGGSP